MNVRLSGHALRDKPGRGEPGHGLVGGAAAVAVGERPGALVRRREIPLALVDPLVVSDDARGAIEVCGRLRSRGKVRA